MIGAKRGATARNTYSKAVKTKVESWWNPAGDSNISLREPVRLLLYSAGENVHEDCGPSQAVAESTEILQLFVIVLFSIWLAQFQFRSLYLMNLFYHCRYVCSTMLVDGVPPVPGLCFYCPFR